jgi:hypothetical protein
MSVGDLLRVVKTKKTDFSEMTATFTLRDGVLDNRDLALKEGKKAEALENLLGVRS